MKGMKLTETERFTTTHNYIDINNMILRKGAVSAREGERLLIPINMRDGSFICTGLGNADWNESAPHGAGRIMSRSAAKKSFTVSAFRHEMTEVFSTTVSDETLDECPMAYKSMDDIVRYIGPSARIEKRIIPIYNFKAGESAPQKRKNRDKNRDKKHRDRS
jgi:RNA-splicing ligase RtcB